MSSIGTRASASRGPSVPLHVRRVRDPDAFVAVGRAAVCDPPARRATTHRARRRPGRLCGYGRAEHSDLARSRCQVRPPSSDFHTNAFAPPGRADGDRRPGVRTDRGNAVMHGRMIGFGPVASRRCSTTRSRGNQRGPGDLRRASSVEPSELASACNDTPAPRPRRRRRDRRPDTARRPPTSAVFGSP